MARRYDPDRRQRIIDAAIRIVAERGIEALSHRAAAAEADVPLGSTTYHFATLDELLVAALRQVCSEPGMAPLTWRRALEGKKSLTDAVTDVLMDYLSGDPGRARLEYELYLAALRREALQPIAAEWLDSMVELLTEHTGGEARARALLALADGLVLQALLTGRRFERAEVREALARVLGP
ncbi:TetR/AcrR family transcriptional regulator [Streptomyces zagrosensis]|uniref:DNA-binding transcriptional regulator YbjK n=1 Tax=Streptomyces zagrosensis TaxID=1042984 RepID=A0A7W9UWK8_9ACTN|nr:TetR family transcriptional regulator [Streptomyces zagrosensis]MBB5933647.1 DNA-binding transcriptional regulator YbjK [Streptomyces zagrosensis]